MLLLRPRLARGQCLHMMGAKTLDVHICKMRKHLQPFGIEIETLWGYGYQLVPDARTRTMELILSHCRRTGTQDRSFSEIPETWHEGQAAQPGWQAARQADLHPDA